MLIIATMIMTTAIIASTATVKPENIFDGGGVAVAVGVGVAEPGSVTVLLVGMNTGCIAVAAVIVVVSVVSVEVVPAIPDTTIQQSSLKPDPGVAVKV